MKKPADNSAGEVLYLDEISYMQNIDIVIGVRPQVFNEETKNLLSYFKKPFTTTNIQKIDNRFLLTFTFIEIDLLIQFKRYMESRVIEKTFLIFHNQGDKVYLGTLEQFSDSIFEFVIIKEDYEGFKKETGIGVILF